MAVWLVSWFFGWLVGVLVGELVFWLVSWLSGWLPGWTVGCLVVQSFACLVASQLLGWSVSRMACSLACSIGGSYRECVTDKLRLILKNVLNLLDST